MCLCHVMCVHYSCACVLFDFGWSWLRVLECAGACLCVLECGVWSVVIVWGGSVSFADFS